ncbi:MAG: hypothetical protein KAI83_03440 [Thiomargarita sp.]|nr:hypothetical protein [Thiomargarita sp.]
MAIEMMRIQENRVFNSVANQLQIPANELLMLCLCRFLERQLNLIKTELFEIYGHYNISSVEEMDARYQEGTLEEADSWRDLQRLDHLEYKRDELTKLLESL